MIGILPHISLTNYDFRSFGISSVGCECMGIDGLARDRKEISQGYNYFLE